MNQNHLRVNRSFMLMNAILAFALFAIVILFLYISFRFQRKADRPHVYSEAYAVSVSPSLAGDSLSVYLNDSLLIARTVPADGLRDTVLRWTEENLLMVVDHANGDRVIPFPLQAEPGQVVIERGEDGEIEVR